MATQANSRPARSAAPAVIRHSPVATSANTRALLILLPAAVVSAVVHVGLFGLLLLVAPASEAASKTEKVDTSMDAKPEEKKQEQPPEPPALTATDVDDEDLKPDADDIKYN